MADMNMKEKLEKFLDAYQDLQTKMGDPDILSDQKEYNRLAKEYADQGPLAKKAAEYISALDDLEAAREMLSDADMKEFAQEEIAGIEDRLPALEEDIKFMLIRLTRPMRRTSSLRSGRLPVVMRLPSSLVTSTGCMSISLRPRGGRPKRWMYLPLSPVATRRSSSRSRETTSIRS